MTVAPVEDDRVIERATRWSAVVLAVLVGGFFAVSNRTEKKHYDELTNLTLPVYIPVASSAATGLPRLPLTDVTSATGVTFVHERGPLGNRRLPEAMGGGSVVFDYDLDGNQDILFVHSSRRESGLSSLALFRNIGDFQFQDVTESSGLMLSTVGMGASAGDFDNDGWPDLIITAIGPNRLLHNLDGRFEEITLSAGVAGATDVWSTASCWVDHDRDGDLDLFVGNYLTWSADLDQKLNCCWNGVDRSYCDPDLYAGSQPYFYQNNGDGTFEDISSRVGVFVRNVDTGQAVPKILAAVATDLNDDGWMDLVATGDGVQNLAYVNTGQHAFEERAVELGLAFDRNGQAVRSFGIDAAHVGENGSRAIVMGRAGNAVKALYLKREDDSLFTDAGLISGFGAQARRFMTFGVCFVDIDLDGRLELLTANGQIQETFNQLQSTQTWTQSPQLYWQSDGPGPRYNPLRSTECGDDLLEPISGRGASFADFDSDGDLDVLLTAVGGPPRFLRNDQQQGHNWLRIVLHGRLSNRSARGTRINAVAASRRIVRELQPVGGYLSQHECTLTLGLGDATSVDSLTISWPDGSVQSLSAIGANRVLIIVEPASGLGAGPAVVEMPVDAIEG